MNVARLNRLREEKKRYKPKKKRKPHLWSKCPECGMPAFKGDSCPVCETPVIPKDEYATFFCRLGLYMWSDE
eukprot:TRINITY_DN1089_c0_g1_i1.p2 TRINITY_DN1089_c0_g1~~TRINITY_DN1089_c0_g1_i1.p2  ORF type:complete len:72 (-),score=11.50 TRINITY_DN1089_c0_g1_i1:52-267(-)